MFQSFDETASPEQGPPRLAQLRDLLETQGLAGYLIPRADAHQGEYVAPGDDRLAWLTGFTGSAGFCIALQEIAGVFVDGRYRVQVRVQVDTDHFAPVDWPETKPEVWLKDNLPNGGKIGFDPWLHTPQQIDQLKSGLDGSGITLCPVENMIDQLWQDQPAPPVGTLSVYPEDLAGEAQSSKRTRLAADLKKAGQSAAVLTLPDSIAWLLNIRGRDIPRNPVAHAFAILNDNGDVALFVDAAKLNEDVRTHLGNGVEICPPEAFGDRLQALTGPVRVDASSAPLWVVQTMEASGTTVALGEDPCILPKATKTDAEIAATRAAHLRDGAAVCEFLSWFD